MSRTLSDSGNTPAQQRAVDATLAANAVAVGSLLALERSAQAEATGYLRRLLDNALRAASVRYVLTFGSLEASADPTRAQTLLDEFVDDLEDLRGYDPTPALQPFVDEARREGVVWGRRDLPLLRADDYLDLATQSDRVTRVLAEIPGNVSAAIGDTQRLARTLPVTSWPDVVALAGRASHAVSGVDRSVSTALSSSWNDSVSQVAEARGAQVLWVAEPNACVVCLALSGHLANPATGEWFDEEATFGRPGSAPAVWPPGQPLTRPPRHPHCRCITETWLGDVRGAGVIDLPAALRREARRSIVLGRSHPTESRAVRIDAAERLLDQGSGLPRSVQQRGRTMVAEYRRTHRPGAHRLH